MIKGVIRGYEGFFFSFLFSVFLRGEEEAMVEINQMDE